MVAFYNAADQELYKKYKFLPQEQYRLGLNLPTTPDPVANQGIVNTNAFTNSGGGNDFNPAGNAFGYGEAVERPGNTYADIAANFGQDSPQAQQALINAGGTYPAGLQSNEGGFEYTSDFGNELDYSKGSFDSLKSPEEKKNFLSKMMNSFRQKTSNLPDWVKTGMTAAQMMNPLTAIPALLSKFGGGSGGGGASYGIAGLSDAKKGAYDALAGGNMLFGGQGGFKTLTGKNFQAKNYVPNQLEIYDKLKDLDKLTSFQKKQLKESSAIYKENIKQEAFKETKEANDLKNEGYSGDGTKDGFGTTSAGNYTNQFSGGDPGTQASGDNDRDPGSGTNNSQHGSSGMSKSQHSAFRMARGGRAGYFFGGRVNYKKGGRVSFKNGGLAGLL